MTPTPEMFLSGYSPIIQETAHALRELVRTAVLEADEKVYTGWQLIGYRAPAVPGKKRTVYFCFVAPLPEEVRLGFEWGVLMDDPAGLLQGTGSQVRYVPCARPEALQEAQLVPLIRAALTVARLSKAEKIRRQLELAALNELNR